MAFSTKIKGNRHLQGHVQVYNVRIPAKMPTFAPGFPLPQDCVEHINRIARVLAQPRGNLLLVGVGGSGRSSCAKICPGARRDEEVLGSHLSSWSFSYFLGLGPF